MQSALDVPQPVSGKIQHPVLDLALAVALGWDAACDIGGAARPAWGFELVASDPTVSRLVATLAEDVDAALAMLSIHA